MLRYLVEMWDTASQSAICPHQNSFTNLVDISVINNAARIRSGWLSTVNLIDEHRSPVHQPALWVGVPLITQAALSRNEWCPQAAIANALSFAFIR